MIKFVIFSYQTKLYSLIHCCRSSGNSYLTDVKQQFVSLCSREADGRGLHQNVIAYSLYGDFSKLDHFHRYFDPINSTLDNVKRVYPGT